MGSHSHYQVIQKVFCISVRVRGVDHIILLAQSSEAWDLWLNDHITGLTVRETYTTALQPVPHYLSQLKNHTAVPVYVLDMRLGNW